MLIIFFITINQLLGIIIAAIILYFYNEYSLEQNSFAGNMMPETKTTTVESFSNIYESLNTTNNKISLEHYLKPKQSNQQIIYDVRQKDNEPSPYRELLKMFPYF